MEYLVWALAGGAVFWFAWLWKDAEKRRLDTKLAHAREREQFEQKVEELQKQLQAEQKQLHDKSLEVAAVKSLLQNVKRERDALQGVIPSLRDVYARTPSWIRAEPLFLLGPGKLRELALWAALAGGVWRDVDALTSQSRRALEEAYNDATKTTVSGESATKLLKEVFSVVRSQPKELGDALRTVFDRRSEDFGQLNSWLSELAQLSELHVARVGDALLQLAADEARAAMRQGPADPPDGGPRVEP